MAITGDEIDPTNTTVTAYVTTIEFCTRDCALHGSCTFWEYDGTRCTLKQGTAAATAATPGTTYGAVACLAVGTKNTSHYNDNFDGFDQKFGRSGTRGFQR